MESPSCAFCGAAKRQRRADKALTCGRVCGARYAQRKRAAKLLDEPDRRFGRMSRRERLIYIKGYAAGYQRAKYRFGPVRVRSAA